MKPSDILDKPYWMWKYYQYRKRFLIHKSFKFNGSDIIIHPFDKFEFEGQADSYIGHHAVISLNGGHVIIGHKCSIGCGLRIYNNKFDTDLYIRGVDKHIATGDIFIHTHAWIGDYVSIMGGVTVGFDSVIGAHSVVTKDVPDHTVVSGVPAKVIKHRS